MRIEIFEFEFQLRLESLGNSSINDVSTNSTALDC